MIRYCLKESEKKICKDMWKLIFSDDDNYVDWYFENIHEDKNLLIHSKNEIIDGMMYENRYKVSVENEIVDTDYLVAVAVAPFNRGEGVMKKLLSKSMLNAKLNGKEFQVLTPVDSNIYKKIGYSYVSKLLFYKTELKNLESIKKELSVREINKNNLEKKDLEKLLEIYIESMKEYDMFIQKNLENIKKSVSELFEENGKIFICEDKNKHPQAYVYFFKNENIFVKEFLFKNIKSAKSLLSVFGGFSNYCKNIEFVIGEATYLEDILQIDKKLEKKVKEKFQLRVLDPLRVLKRFSKKLSSKDEIIIEIIDNVIEENNVRVLVGNNIVEKTDRDWDLKINIEIFSKLFYGYRGIKDILKMEEAILKNEEKLSILEKIKKIKSYFNQDF